MESATRACILQHSRERRTAIGTARMAHLSLPNSELHQGLPFEEYARVRTLCAEPGTALLFSGEGRESHRLSSPARLKVGRSAC